MALHDTGLMIIRAWVEPGESAQLCVELSLSKDVLAIATMRTMLTDAVSVAVVLQRWLAEVIGASDR